jgi:hypothetical protein
MCPHTAIYMSSYSYICVLIQLYMCPHTAIHVSSYSNICVLIHVHMCPHTAIYVCALIASSCAWKHPPTHLPTPPHPLPHARYCCHISQHPPPPQQRDPPPSPPSPPPLTPPPPSSPPTPPPPPSERDPPHTPRCLRFLPPFRAVDANQRMR